MAMFLRAARHRPSVKSATASAFRPGACTTATPRRSAAGRSTLTGSERGQTTTSRLTSPLIVPASTGSVSTMSARTWSRSRTLMAAAAAPTLGTCLTVQPRLRSTAARRSPATTVLVSASMTARPVRAGPALRGPELLEITTWELFRPTGEVHSRLHLVQGREHVRPGYQGGAGQPGQVTGRAHPHRPPGRVGQHGGPGRAGAHTARRDDRLRISRGTFPQLSHDSREGLAGSSQRRVAHVRAAVAGPQPDNGRRRPYLPPLRPEAWVAGEHRQVRLRRLDGMHVKALGRQRGPELVAGRRGDAGQAVDDLA